MQPFATIYARAAERKGGEKNLLANLPFFDSPAKLRKKPDSFYLAEMTAAVFRSGFVWKVIENKWPGFEQAFHNFDPKILALMSDEQWEALESDTRIVRHRAKIYSVRENLVFVHDLIHDYGSVGKMIADWPEQDLIGLLAKLKKEGNRLGGMTGQYFLAYCGKSCFITSPDVVRCIQEAGVEIADNPTSQRDLRAVQETFNVWHEESGLPYRHLSAIAARSVGENYYA